VNVLVLKRRKWRKHPRPDRQTTHLAPVASEISQFFVYSIRAKRVRLTVRLNRAAMVSMTDPQQSSSRQLSGLRTMSRQQLADLWRGVFRTEPPAGVRREILIAFLAYRIQENVYGSLKADVRAELLRVTKCSDGNMPTKKRASIQRLRAGTRIIRKWRGENHEIFVTETSYEYRGDSYRSLSHIARKITGTRWSGPAFFGLGKPFEGQKTNA
jgi:DUF2924 family protein